MPNTLVEQGQLAKKWREARGLSRPALGSLIGYSPSEIECMERGKRRNNGNPIAARDFQTFKLACAAVAANVEFDWGPITIRL